MGTADRVSRREFGRRSVAVGVASALPSWIPSSVLASPGKPGANERIGLGIIGTGRRARQMYGEIADVCKSGCQVVAGCDLAATGVALS